MKQFLSLLKNNSNLKSITLVIVVILFVYSFLFKVLKTDDFVRILYQSGFINQNWIKEILYFSINIDLLVAATIVFKNSLGLFITFSVILSYTLYLFYINNFSFNIGCGCGGIFPYRSYTFNLLINIIILFLIIINIYYNENSKSKNIFN